MSRTTIALAFSIAALTVATCASTALAQSGMARACAGDVKALCAGVQPGGGRVKACIKAHVSDLSEPCQAVLLKAAAIGKACAADIKQDCAEIKPGGGRIEACMKSHLADVSEPCKDAISQAAAGKS
jgi:Cysteine rich repeat